MFKFSYFVLVLFCIFRLERFQLGLVGVFLIEFPYLSRNRAMLRHFSHY